ncbi:MAG: Bug family tripartite tricarboxylate transporter substrate binding protein [bacterium]
MNASKLSALMVLALALPGPIAVAQAAEAPGPYPSRPIRYVVPFAPGGPTDIMSRAIAERLSVALGTPVVVDNRAGAGGGVGAEIVARSAPDGYTLMIGHVGTHAINISLYAKVNYDPIKDFQPISMIATLPFVLVVNPGVPAKNVKDLIALARSRPGAINFASGGTGSSSQMNVEQFRSLAKIELAHVPYKGTASAIPDLLVGEVQMAIDTVAALLPHIKSGRLRALGVGDRVRSPLLSGVPTIEEAGVPGYEMYGGTGVLAPARTPREIVDRLSREINAVLKEPEVVQRFTELAVRPTGNTPEQFRVQMKNDMARYAKIIANAGIQPQ